MRSVTVPFAAWVALAGLVVTVVLLALVPLTGPDQGIRVESAFAPSAAAASPDTNDEPSDAPFTVEDIRSYLLDQPAGEPVEVDTRTAETLLYCADCLSLATPLEIEGERFQIALVNDPGSDSVTSASVIAEDAGNPSLRLVVSGHELSLTPGRGGTLVAQDSQYGPGDRSCCPSGWSVQVYRYQDGRFEAGQRISQAGED